MSSISVLLGVKRRLGQISRRAKSGPVLRVGPLSLEVHELLGELRVSAERDPEFAVELALSLLEQLPAVFEEIDDRDGLLGKALDTVPGLLTELLMLDHNRTDSALDRPAVFERIFLLWIEDGSGYLRGLERALLNSLVDGADEQCVHEIAQCFLRDLPLVFPAGSNEKLDIERHLLRNTRHSVDRLVGEVHARHGDFEHLIFTSAQWLRDTGDAVDHIDALEQAGLWEEALTTARNVLRDSSAPRRDAVRSAYERIAAAHSKDALETKQLQRSFLNSPTWETWSDLMDVVSVDLRCGFVDETLNTLESLGTNRDLCFQLYVEEGLILEADGLAAHQPIGASTLAACAESIADEHPGYAAGWMLTAAYATSSLGRRSAYKKAVEFLLRVQELSLESNQPDGFLRALATFREHNRRRRSLIDLVNEAF